MIRIGHGYDAHRFDALRKKEPQTESEQQHITIGGVKIPHSKPLLAHSDGDVLIHALCDALLGALALGDIGKHFPDTDNNYKNIDSRKLLSRVFELIRKKAYQLGNADITIVAQTPKMSPYIQQMQKNIADDCICDISRVNIKATTTEKMGFTGREEGIAVHAVVLLIQKQ